MTVRVKLAETNLEKIQQTVKWTVYGLLLINFGFYIMEDWSRAQFTLTADSTFFDWTSEFATSIDESAWFILLLMFELETYTLEDEQWKGWVAKLVHGIRILAFVMIGHTVYANANTLIAYQPSVPVDNAVNLCDLASADVSYVFNLEYTDVNEATCRSLDAQGPFYWVGDDAVVATRAGLDLERDLAVADVIEVILWLLVIASIEFMVRLQERGITDSPLIHFLNRSKLVLYAGLIALGVYWASLSHWLYLWDELLWIGGFAAIEMNMSQWRDEIENESEENQTELTAS